MRKSCGLWLTLVLFAAGCAQSTTSIPNTGVNPASGALHVARPSQSGKIQHVIVMVQGHRGFDNLFAGFPGADAPTHGYDHLGKVVRLRSMTESEQPSGPPVKNAFAVAYDNGTMYGFDLVYPHDALFPYHFVERKQVSQYWKLAQQFALADHMFSTSISNSGFVAQLYLLTARSEVRSNVYIADHPSAMPWGCDAPAGTTTPIYTRHGIRAGPYPCFSWNSLPAELDAASISWRYYLRSDGLATNAVDAIQDIRNGKDWSTNVVTPQTRILSDIANGTLPAVSWVYPDPRDSDDPGTGSGSKWVATVVGALRNSSYWQNSAVLITWEASDYFYDNVAPPRYDLAELGFRVPLIAVSPYAKQGYVSHTEHEFGSILHFIEVQFGLSSLGATDERADSLSDMFTL